MKRKRNERIQDEDVVCIFNTRRRSVGRIIIHPQKDTRCVPLLERMSIELMISKAEKQELHSRDVT